MIAYIKKYNHAAPLAVFRILFGFMLFAGIIRFWLNGWIEELYIKPHYFFSYYGFEFVKPLGVYTWWLFVVCAISALTTAMGLFYRASVVILFTSFTYIELIDKSTYLNHYYFVSMVLFMLIFVPAHVYFSIDSLLNKKLSADYIPAWCIDVFKIFICILYFYAGIAKINSDWLLHALPLKIWLPAKNDVPVIGFLFNYSWVHYAFSWFGCLYDLSIPFLLWNKKTRTPAYLAVVVFHLLTALLFPIGMFPYIMIVTALIFFPADFHISLVNRIKSFFPDKLNLSVENKKYVFKPLTQTFLLTLFSVFFVFHLLFPFRYLLYPGELFWTEEGYRFSWRVMLMEKAGYAQFIVKDATGKRLTINNDLFLTDLQEKMVSTQPDMMLQYAHMLRDYYEKEGYKSPQVYVDSYVALNGRMGKVLIDTETDLAKEKDLLHHKNWIIPFDDDIKGF